MSIPTVTNNNNNRYYQYNLTKNGNPYNPVRIGAFLGGAAGIIKGSLIADNFKFTKNDETLTGILKNNIDKFGKATGFIGKSKAALGVFGACLAIGAVVAVFANLGSLLGNTLYDAAKNQELRDQADGEMEIEKKNIIANLFNSMFQKEDKTESNPEQVNNDADLSKVKATANISTEMLAMQMHKQEYNIAFNEIPQEIKSDIENAQPLSNSEIPQLDTQPKEESAPIEDTNETDIADEEAPEDSIETITETDDEIPAEDTDKTDAVLEEVPVEDTNVTDTEDEEEDI